MKKFLLIISSVLAFNLDASNCVPVVSGIGSADQPKVFQQILQYSFVTNLDPENFRRLSPPEVQRLIDDELGLLSEKICEVTPKAVVQFISKSLYQLFVQYTMLKQFLDCYDEEAREGHLDDSGESEKLRKIFSRWIFETKADSDQIGFLDNIPSDIFQSIRDYHNNPYVQNAFWDINQNIYSFISEKDVAQESELREIIQSLINELTQQYEKMRQLKSGHTYMLAGIVVILHTERLMLK